MDQGVDNFTAYVCENLGAPDERVTQGELAEIAAHEFSPLNVMVLVRKPHTPDRPRELVGRRLFGNPDDLFLQSKPMRGLLTPAELRAMALAQLDLGPASVVWDIGAGSGSVAVEAAQIAAAGEVYAIEMDPEEHQLIVENARRFDVKNLKPILGRARRHGIICPTRTPSSSATAGCGSPAWSTPPTSGCGEAAGWW